jgi:hypothetical protein
MGNLSSQYISQSFQSLLHLGSDTTASVTSAEIQDALGNGVGVFVSTLGNLKVTNAISASAISASTLFGIGDTVSYSASVAGQLQALENITSSLINVTGSYATTGSNNFIGNQSVTGDITLTGTLSAYAVKTIFETSSVIYSSGSNQFGDASNDTQTLIGRTNISGSLSVTGSSIAFKGEVSASYISTSVLQGLGIVSDFSSSVASQFYTNTQLVNSFTQSITDLNVFTQSAAISIDNLQIFTASANISFTNLNSFTASIAGTNAYTASQNTKNTTLASYTGSNDTKWTTLLTTTASFSSSIGQLNSFTASQNTKNTTLAQFTGSVMTTTASLNTFTASIAGTNSYTASNNTKWTTLENVTSSLIAATGSYASKITNNSFSGSNVFTGSVEGNVEALTITSTTATMDCSVASFFTLTLANSVNTFVDVINVRKGKTYNLLIAQAATPGTVTFSSNVNFAGTPIATPSAGAKDLTSMVSFDTTSLYASYINNL